MHYVFASDPMPWLAPWGQAAAIVLLLYLLVLILLGIVLRLTLMVGLSWTSEKVQLIKRLRPTVNAINTTTESAIAGTLPPSSAYDSESKVIRTIAEVPAQMQKVEQKIDEGSMKVDNAVIEFRARTEMVKAMAKAFFLPGLAYRHEERAGIEIESPGYRMLMAERAPEGTTAVGESYAGNVSASQLKEAPVEVPVSSSRKNKSQ